MYIYIYLYIHVYIYVCTYGGWFPIMCFIYGWSMESTISLGRKERLHGLPLTGCCALILFPQKLMGTSESDSLICWVHPLRKGYLNPIESHIKSHQSVKFHGSILKMALIEPFLFGPSSPPKNVPKSNAHQSPERKKQHKVDGEVHTVYPLTMTNIAIENVWKWP